MSTTRIAPLEPPYEPEVAALLARMMPEGVEPITLFRLFARNLPMATAMHEWGRYELGRALSVSRRQREIVILRTCARAGCEYEWGVHVAFFSERVGLDSEQIRSLTHGSAEDACWDSRERALIRLADRLVDTVEVDGALWAELEASFEPHEILDLLFLCGWYRTISAVARSAGVPREPWAPTFAECRID